MPEPLLTARIAARLTQEAVAAAEELLAAHHPERTAPIPLERIALDAGFRVGRRRAQSSAICFYVQAEGARGVLGVNLRLGPAAQRTAVAHALGHALLHDRPFVLCYPARALIEPAADGSVHASTPSVAMDYAANAFAEALLVPAGLVHAAAAAGAPGADRESIIRDLAHAFEVPASTMAHRLIELGLIVL